MKNVLGSFSERDETINSCKDSILRKISPLFMKQIPRCFLIAERPRSKTTLSCLWGQLPFENTRKTPSVALFREERWHFSSPPLLLSLPFLFLLSPSISLFLYHFQRLYSKVESTIYFFFSFSFTRLHSRCCSSVSSSRISRRVVTNYPIMFFSRNVVIFFFLIRLLVVRLPF